MQTNNKDIMKDKIAKRKAEHERKERNKQLDKRRARIYDEMVAFQKKNAKKVKHAPKDAYISLRHINKIYDNKVQAVFDFNLDIKQHEFIVFVGPSGCGKSTTLRMIAGLEDITAGDLFIDKTYANDLHPKDRDIAMVFQSYALYPHMTVSGNMAFGLKIRKIPVLKIDEKGEPVLEINKKLIKKLQIQLSNLQKCIQHPAKDDDINQINHDIEELKGQIEYLEKTPVEVYQYRHMDKEQIAKRVKEAARILQIEEYLDRKPKALSGGQCQRVALGRAIVRNAKVFLMDEPLSNLDAKLRVAMRSEIIKLHQSLKATTIYVTHDQTEAMTMASRIVVMNKGFIQQIGTPIEIYNHPANMFVATFIGSPAMNLFNVTYDNNTITFAKGAKITLTDDFAEAIKKFYEEEPKRLKEELDKLEEAFIEKKQYLNTIDSLKEKIAKATDNKEKQRLTSRLLQAQEELKYCEESNQRIQNIIASLDKLNNVDITKPIDVVFGIRPEDIYQKGRVLTDEAISQEFNLTVSVAELLGHEYFVHTDFEGGELVSKIHAKTIVSSGDQLQLVFDISKMHIFDSITQKRIK